MTVSSKAFPSVYVPLMLSLNWYFKSNRLAFKISFVFSSIISEIVGVFASHMFF